MSDPVEISEASPGREEGPLERLENVLRSFESCLAAYSGGVDSVLLAYVAHRVLGERALAVIADSPSLPRRELAEALAIGEEFGFPVRVVRTSEFDDSEYLNNTRCSRIWRESRGRRVSRRSLMARI
jgi:PP-loop superfamily ATP-utilizing enzyme